MKSLIIAVAMGVGLGVGGAAIWQAHAAAPATAVPQAALDAPIHSVDCRGSTGSHGCGSGYYWRNGSRGWACYPC
jgi:hypothetical protein